MGRQPLYPHIPKSTTPADLHDKIAGSLIKSEALIEELWASGRMEPVIQFYADQLEGEVSRQIRFLQAFLGAVQKRQKGRLP